MLDRLIKFSPLQIAEGQLGFQGGVWVWIGLALIAIGLLGLVVLYARSERYGSGRRKAVSFGLRALALVLLVLPLMEPVLITPDVVPDENFVAVVVDGSASMAIPDGPEGATRLAIAQDLLDGENGLLTELGGVFKLRTYGFSDRATRADSVYGLAPEGTATNLSAALGRVMADFRGTPLAGIVLVTDGGDTSTDVPLNQAEELARRDIPLHIIGVGQEAFAADREVIAATVAKGIEETTGAEVDVKVRSWQAEPSPVTLRLFRGEQEVLTETRRLKGDGRIDQFTLFYEPDAPGADVYTLRLDAAGEELHTANNALDLLIDTQRDSLGVLFFEGGLSPEFKFIKRALEDDPVIDFTSVARTGTGKLYRQGVRAAGDLAGGFPASDSALYRYKAVVLGDIESSTFTLEQLAQLERFVRVRGGGLLMLGGRQSFAEGGYTNTPVADALPVAIDPARRTVLPPSFERPGAEDEEEGFRFLPTAVGLENPILKLSPDPDQNRRLWSEMPGLQSLNFVGTVKPGAAVLAEKPEDDFGPSEPLLAVHRYGRGRAAALPTSSTWRWQLDLDAEDTRHERFWRQLTRWLVASAPDRVTLDAGPDRLAPSTEAPLTVRVYDAGYRPVTDASVAAVIADPTGERRTLSFQADLTEDGAYTASFVPQATGIYTMLVDAEAGGEAIGTQEHRILVQPSNQEVVDATLKRAFLQRLAEAAGGVYYDTGALDALPEALRNRRTSTSVYRADYLWDVPLLLLLALLLLGTEWALRRRWGLA